MRGNGVDRPRAHRRDAIPKMAPQFAIMDRAVAKTGYLVGDSFTLADAYLTPIALLHECGARKRAR